MHASKEQAKVAADALTTQDKELEIMQAQVASLKIEVDSIEAELTTQVKAQLMYQFMMGHTSSWDPTKEIDHYLEWVGSMKDLIDTNERTKIVLSLP